MLGVKLNSLCRSVKNKFTSILPQYSKTSLSNFSPAVPSAEINTSG